MPKQENKNDINLCFSEYQTKEGKSNYNSNKKSRRSKIKCQTKNGRLKSKNAEKIFITLPLIIILATSQTKAFSSNFFTELEILEESPEFLENHNISESNDNKPRIKLEIETPKLEEDLEKTLENEELKQYNVTYQKEDIETIINQTERIQKRFETDYLFGNEIEIYSSRWGLPNSLVSALLTQERPDKGKQNIGQLTRSMCGEKIIVPIIQKTEEDINLNRNVDKFYIVRDEPKKENYTNYREYQKQLEIYQQQLITAKELKNEQYEIIPFETLISEEGYKENIRISLAYLTHCIYKCHSKPNNGIRAYNCGYPQASKATTYEIMTGQTGEENTDLFYNLNVFRFLLPEEAINLQFELIPFPEDWHAFSLKEQEKYLSEDIKNAEHLITTINLTNFNPLPEEVNEKIGPRI